MTEHRRIVLASRPSGPVLPENFRLETVSLPALAAGQLMVRNRCCRSIHTCAAG
jgi:hypothetical protein